MLKTILGIVALVFVYQLVIPPDAEARRGSRWRGSGKPVPIIVPIPRGSTDVVFVKKLPDLESFEHEGRHFDLGYKHGWFGGGEWVGYFRGTPPGYVELNQKAVEEMVLPMVGVTIADVPGKGLARKGNGSGQASKHANTEGGGTSDQMPGLSGIAMGWPIFVLGLAVLGIGGAMRKSLRATAERNRTKTLMEEPATVHERLMMPEQSAKFDASIERALRERRELAQTRQQAGRTGSAPEISRHTVARAAAARARGNPRPAFGKR